MVRKGGTQERSPQHAQKLEKLMRSLQNTRSLVGQHAHTVAETVASEICIVHTISLSAPGKIWEEIGVGPSGCGGKAVTGPGGGGGQLPINLHKPPKIICLASDTMMIVFKMVSVLDN
jgi:hypothetical protein